MPYTWGCQRIACKNSIIEKNTGTRALQSEFASDAKKEQWKQHQQNHDSWTERIMQKKNAGRNIQIIPSHPPKIFLHQRGSPQKISPNFGGPKNGPIELLSKAISSQQQQLSQMGSGCSIRLNGSRQHVYDIDTYTHTYTRTHTYIYIYNIL